MVVVNHVGLDGVAPGAAPPEEDGATALGRVAGAAADRSWVRRTSPGFRLLECTPTRRIGALIADDQSETWCGPC